MASGIPRNKLLVATNQLILIPYLQKEKLIYGTFSHNKGKNMIYKRNVGLKDKITSSLERVNFNHLGGW